MAQPTLYSIRMAIKDAAAQNDTARVQRLTDLLKRATEAGVPDGGMAWGDVATSAVVNAIPSGGRFLGDMYNAAIHPVNTANAVLDATAGGISRGLEYATGLDMFPENQATATADAVGKFYKDRYGSMDGFKQALAEDPIGVLSDATVPLTGGGSALVKGAEMGGKVAGLAKTANIVGKVGRGMKVAGDIADPVTVLGKGAGKAVQGIASVSSGLGMAPIRAAYDAAKAGGGKAKAFYDNMRGRVPMSDVLDGVNDAADNIEAAGQAAYKRDISSSIANKTPIDWTPIHDAYNTVIDSLTTSGGTFKGGEPARIMAKKVAALIKKYYNNPTEHTIEGLDALKQELQGLEVKSAAELTAGQGQANRLATSVANSVKNEIVRLDPKYAATMANYKSVQDLLRELGQTFKTHGRSSVDTALRSLQSTMRNNAYTSYGHRGKLLDQLDAAGQGTLRPTLAGQAMNSWEPRGIARAGGAFAIPAAGAWALGHPGMIAAVAPFIPAAIPRVVGEVTGLLGSTAGKIDRNPVAKTIVKGTTSRVPRTVAAKTQTWVVEDAQGNRYDANGKLVK